MKKTCEICGSKFEGDERKTVCSWCRAGIVVPSSPSSSEEEKTPGRKKLYKPKNCSGCTLTKIKLMEWKRLVFRRLQSSL